jgi:putative exporter of polyketide antibiotics
LSWAVGSVAFAVSRTARGQKTLAFAAIGSAFLVRLLVVRIFVLVRLLDGCTARGQKTLAFAAMLAAFLVRGLVVCIC